MALGGAAACTAAGGWVAWSYASKPSDLPSRKASSRQRRVLAETTLPRPAANLSSSKPDRAKVGAAGGGARACLLDRSQLDGVRSRIDSIGICVVEDVLSAETQKHLDRVAAGVWQTRGKLVYGRVHSDLMDAPERQAVEQLCEGLIPLVEEFFSSGENGRHTSRSEQNESKGTRCWYLSQLQFVDAMPGCASQFWHCDNTARGLTFLIPLVPTTAENGPTELFPSSHRIWQSSASDANDGGGEEPPGSDELGSPAATGAAMKSFLNLISTAQLQDVAPVRAMVGPGAAIIYDSRTLHRGRTNLTSARRPALVLRYDMLSTPPPGMGAVATSMVRVVGDIAERVCSRREEAVEAQALECSDG
eukprot:COSAG02_NODE_639_length_19078_cov_9.380262_15_plen_362_part_00